MTKHTEACKGVHIWANAKPDYREAFEAMRVALTIYRTHEHPLSEPCRNHACAALALADKVSRPACPDPQDFETDEGYQMALKAWEAGR